MMLLNCGVGEDSRESLGLQGSNQSILKEISPEYLLEELMLKLKLQFFQFWCEELTHLKRPWCWERLKVGEEGATEDEMVGGHHGLNGHKLTWLNMSKLQGWVGDGQGGLASCSPWGHKESDTTERLNCTELSALFLSTPFFSRLFRLDFFDTVPPGSPSSTCTSTSVLLLWTLFLC